MIILPHFQTKIKRNLKNIRFFPQIRKKVNIQLVGCQFPMNGAMRTVVWAKWNIRFAFSVNDELRRLIGREGVPILLIFQQIRENMGGGGGRGGGRGSGRDGGNVGVVRCMNDDRGREKFHCFVGSESTCEFIYKINDHFYLLGALGLL